jgi:hypothetical protein
MQYAMQRQQSKPRIEQSKAPRVIALPLRNHQQPFYSTMFFGACMLALMLLALLVNGAFAG